MRASAAALSVVYGSVDALCDVDHNGAALYGFAHSFGKPWRSGRYPSECLEYHYAPYAGSGELVAKYSSVMPG